MDVNIYSFLYLIGLFYTYIRVKKLCNKDKTNGRTIQCIKGKNAG
jgi:hypothetical protein